MSSEQFEHKLREKFREAEITPSADLWAKIEQEVQGDSDKKGGFWFFLFGEGFLLALALLAYFFFPVLPPHSNSITTSLNPTTSALDTSTQSDIIPNALVSPDVENLSTDLASTKSDILEPNTPVLQEIPLSSYSQLQSTSIRDGENKEVFNILVEPILLYVDVSIPESSLLLPQQLNFSSIHAPSPTLLAPQNTLRESWEDLIPLNKNSGWAWEATYSYLGGISGTGQTIAILDEGILGIEGNGRGVDFGFQEEDNLVDSPSPTAANDPGNRRRTYTISHASGIHKWGIGGSYLINENLFLETGFNYHLSEIGTIKEGIGEGAPTGNLVLDSPVRRVILSEREQFQQHAISIPVGLGLQLGKGRTKIRLSSGAQFEGILNHASDKLDELLGSPGTNFAQLPPSTGGGIIPETGLIQQNQIYLSGRLMYLIRRDLHFQLGAQFFYLTEFDANAQIINGYDFLGGLNLGLIWTPSRQRIFRTKNH